MVFGSVKNNIKENEKKRNKTTEPTEKAIKDKHLVEKIQMIIVSMVSLL